jgi:ATP-binding cassette, subfamily B, bacterial
MINVSFKTIFLFICRMLKPFSFSVGIMFFMAIFWAIEVSLSPYLLKVIVNRIENTQGDVFHGAFWPAIGYVSLIFFLIVSFRLYGYFVEIKMIPSLRRRIATFSFDHLLNQSHTFYQNNFAGSLSNKINDLIQNVPTIAQITIDRFFSSALALSIAIFTLWHVNQAFGLSLVFFIASFLGGYIFFSKRLASLADAWAEEGSSITGRFVDVLGNMLSVRLFARQSGEKIFLDEACQKAVKAEKKLQWAFFWVWSVYGFAFFLSQAANLYFLIKGRQEGWITIGDFALVMVLNLSIVEFLWKLTMDFSQFSKEIGKISQALRTILAVPEMTDSIDAKPLTISKGEIVFDQVHFHYKGTESLFKNKTVTINAGQKVGLVGYSGSGKTTFVNLILRLYELTAGRILVDGQNIAKVTEESLHSAIGMIPQEPSLFHRTLLDNIRYGNLEATDEAVIEAAKKAYAHEFIVNIPERYNAMVGERGIKLSGGQRQRIAIARAILKNAPILILDEATSQLDSLTETYIQESLWELMQGKTTLVIAHRLSTLLHMDRILVFDQGVIVQDGTHAELLSEEGLYKTLWDTQVGGFLPEARKEQKA